MSIMGSNDVQSPIHAFRYTRAQKNTIRLFRFLPQSTAESLQLEMVSDLSFERTYYYKGCGYFALSYCWGDQNLTETILLNGCSFRITNSLFSALRSIQNWHISEKVLGRFYREENPRDHFWMWSDAICINQQDIEEKNEQVQNMWRIYSTAGASGVLTWLGDESENTLAAYNAIEKHSANCKRTWGGIYLCRSPLDPVLEPAEEAGLIHLSSRAYFNRAWTIAEYSQRIHEDFRPVILCGRHVFDGHKIHHLIATKTVRPRQEYGPFATLHEKPGNTFGLRVYNLLFDLMLVTGCANPRDRMFAMATHPEVRLFSWRELTVDYRISLHALVLTTLEWYEDVLHHSWSEAFWPQGVDTQTVINDASDMFVRLCKGLECWKDDDTIEKWFERHLDLDISQLPRSILLGSGQRIRCRALLKAATYPIHGVTLDIGEVPKAWIE